jgi:hypothetical protein
MHVTVALCPSKYVNTLEYHNYIFHQGTYICNVQFLWFSVQFHEVPFLHTFYFDSKLEV